jgi:hypothetical protein
MNIYEIEFMRYTNGMRDTVWSKELDKYLSVSKEGFVAKESDLEYLRGFGGGFRRLKFIGELFNNNTNGIIVNVSCNLVGKEDVEKVIEELQNKLNNLRVNISI